MTTLIAVQDLHKTYRLGRVDVPVLRGATLDVQEGEWLAVLGASGSGKSTLLHLMGGLDRPDKRKNGNGGGGGAGGKRAGSIRFGSDTALHEYSERRLNRFRADRVGFVFQFYHLLPELTVLQNVTVAGMVRHGRFGFRKGPAEAHARGLLDAFGLSHRLKHRPAELSGGERQRVAIARGLMNQPQVLLADEPTGNLDRATGDKILDAIADLRRKRGQTIVMVTHDQAVAARADRVIRLEDGRVAPA
jgi:lipoprotein-releasing system ATP-binding protein